MINELLGIQYNIEKARLDGKVQNLAYYINEMTLTVSHKEMDRKKAKGIDGISKDDYSVNLKDNVEHLVKRMRNGSYQPEPIRRAYIPKDGSNKMRPLGISCYEDKLKESNIIKHEHARTTRIITSTEKNFRDILLQGLNVDKA